MVIEITYGFAAFDFAEVPLTQNSIFYTEMGGWNTALINPLGISPVNRTLSNILELGWEGLSMYISPCAAPSKFRSLTPALRVETMGGGNLAEFPLNVRYNKNTPAIRTGIGLQRHIYVVPKPPYLVYVFTSLSLKQKALQKYNDLPNLARNVKTSLTFWRKNNIRKIAARRKYVIYNDLQFRKLSNIAKSKDERWCNIPYLSGLPP